MHANTLYSRSEPHARARLTSLKMHLGTLFSDRARASSHGFRPCNLAARNKWSPQICSRIGCITKNACDLPDVWSYQVHGEAGAHPQSHYRLSHGRRQNNGFLIGRCFRHIAVAMHPLIHQHGPLAGFHAEYVSPHSKPFSFQQHFCKGISMSLVVPSLNTRPA
jgi:hypothetical protein